MNTLLSILLLIAVGCSTRQPQSIEGIKNATEAWLWSSGKVDFTDSSTWPTEIKELNPERIYSHRVNAVLVMKTKGNRESGYYIMPVRSSHFPPLQDPEWTLIAIGNGIWSYDRERANQSEQEEKGRNLNH